MQRLVYTPRVYVFIKNSEDQIRDVSRYVTAGNVNRRTGAASTAEVTLRNPDRIFTTPDEDGAAAFSPMDPITIYLKRVRGRPVRVFTGFLDKAPYLQLFPGTVTLRASCTLKKLLYTFFDPALPYTQSFLAEYGWAPDPNNQGQWLSFNGLNDFRKTQNQDSAEYHKITGNDLATANDGSVGELLYATMKRIGHWNPEDIYIEALPNGLFQRLAELAQQFESDNDEARREFEELMRRILGEGGYGSGAGVEVDLSGIDGSVAEQVYEVGKRLNVPYKHMLAAFMTGIVETNFHNLPYGDADSAGWRQERASLYPDPTNVPHSAKRFYEECRQLDRGQSAGDLAADVQRPREDLRYKYGAVRDKAVALLRKTKQKVDGKDDQAAFDSSSTQGQGLDPQRVIRSRNNNKGDSSGSTKLVSPIKGLSVEGWPGPQGSYGAARSYGAHRGVDAPSTLGEPWYSITDGVVAAVNQNWANGQPMVLVRCTQEVKGYPKPLYLGYGSFESVNVSVGQRVTAGDMLGKGGQHGSGPHLHFFLANNSGATNGTMDPTSFLKSAAQGQQPTGGPGGGSSGGADASAGDPAIGGAAASAFYASINMPTMMEALEATALGGQKSLMNDKPLMPFVQQLCQASLREFMSMPDGKFLAFYPDYFGEMFHRKPYWLIDDIEILDGKVDLTDEALVTHMYVVGDTTMSQNDTLNSIFSSGVVTIFNAFMADSVINRKPVDDKRKREDAKKGSGPRPMTKNDPRGMDLVLDKDEAIQFLNRFGARPMVEDVPMIKHPFFEMFLAYQRFLTAWSRQFLTTFTFTFMPELYPGGKVGFPDHGLQMYIDEVTHSWDYTSGFTTQANLSSPAVMIGDNGQPVKEAKNLPPNMVKAIVAPSIKTARTKSGK